jgi:hypothetical protein
MQEWTNMTVLEDGAILAKMAHGDGRIVRVGK